MPLFFVQQPFVSAYDIFNYEGLILSDLLTRKGVSDFSTIFFYEFCHIMVDFKERRRHCHG